jgi:hypothetical protein
MNVLARLDRFDDFMPEFCRRFARPFALEDAAPAEIRINVIENNKDYAVRAELTLPKRGGPAARSIAIQ